jgi:hypothetical protein
MYRTVTPKTDDLPYMGQIVSYVRRGYARVLNFMPTPKLNISITRSCTLAAAPATQEGRFVINLYSVVAPVTIPQPRASQITRFQFF